MIERRGCMTALFHEGYMYVIGGLNYTEKCLRKCERYRLTLNDSNTVVVPDFASSVGSRGSGVGSDAGIEKWRKVADLREARKNASACSMTSDTIYVFGGTSNQVQTLSSIE